MKKNTDPRIDAISRSREIFRRPDCAKNKRAAATFNSSVEPPPGIHRVDYGGQAPGDTAQAEHHGAGMAGGREIAELEVRTLLALSDDRVVATHRVWPTFAERRAHERGTTHWSRSSRVGAGGRGTLALASIHANQ